MRVIYQPTANRGRRPIAGTVLAGRASEYVLVKLCYSLAANAGNSGSPRTEVWIGLRERTFAPVIVRRIDIAGIVGAWKRIRLRDTGFQRANAIAALRSCHFRPTALRRNRSVYPDWPLTIWDRRVILPDDPRWPRGAKKWMRDAINRWLATRNDCPDEHVWRIDAQILAVAPRAN